MKTKNNKQKYYEFKNVADNEYELYLYGEVSSWEEDINATDFKAELDNIKDGATITAYINSVGGSVFEGWAISNMLKRKKCKKNAIIDGICASIATGIACAFDNVQMYKNSLYMIHNASTMAWGNANEIEKQVDSLRKIDDNIVQTYVDRTGLDTDKIKEYMNNETWFSAKEALELGFTDGIIDKDNKVTNIADSKVLAKYKNVPTGLIAVEDKETDKKIDDELELMRLQIELM